MLNERKIQHHERSHLNFEMHPQEPLFRGLTERNEAIGIRAVKRVFLASLSLRRRRLMLMRTPHQSLPARQTNSDPDGRRSDGVGLSLGGRSLSPSSFD